MFQHHINDRDQLVDSLAGVSECSLLSTKIKITQAVLGLLWPANDWEGLWCILEPTTRGGEIESDILSVIFFFF